MTGYAAEVGVRGSKPIEILPPLPSRSRMSLVGPAVPEGVKRGDQLPESHFGVRIAPLIHMFCAVDERELPFHDMAQYQTALCSWNWLGLAHAISKRLEHPERRRVRDARAGPRSSGCRPCVVDLVTPSSLESSDYLSGACIQFIFRESPNSTVEERRQFLTRFVLNCVDNFFYWHWVHGRGCRRDRAFIGLERPYKIGTLDSSAIIASRLAPRAWQSLRRPRSHVSLKCATMCTKSESCVRKSLLSSGPKMTSRRGPCGAVTLFHGPSR